MSSITFDASEVTSWGNAMAQAPDALRSELMRTTSALTSFGVSTAQDLAPVDQGNLKASIVPGATVFAGGEVRGSYSTHMVYAAIQEYGGTITPKRGKYLVFMGNEGHLVRVASVTIPAHPYMQPSAEAVRKRMHDAYGAAVKRALARSGVTA